MFYRNNLNFNEYFELDIHSKQSETVSIKKDTELLLTTLNVLKYV